METSLTASSYLKSIGISLCALCLMTSPLAFGESPKDKHLTPEQVARDVALAEETYERIHPGYTRYTSDKALNAAWQGVIDQANANGGMTLGEFYIESNRVLALIRCDHTKAELTQDMAEERNSVPVYLPMRWDMVDGRGFVTVPADSSGLERGDEILAIDGDPLSERVEAVLPLLPYDGKTEWVRYNEAAQSYEFRGGGVDHFGALLFETGPSAELTIKRGEAVPQTITVDRITHPDWRALGDGVLGAANFKDGVTFKRIGDKAAYLKVDTFVNYRDPIKPDKLYDPIFKSIKDEKRDTLIVDLRENGGGSNDAAIRLAAHLMPNKAAFKKDIRVKTLIMDGLEDYLWTWDSRALNPNPLGFTKNDDGTYSLRKMVDDDLKITKPDKTAFDGKLILLTSEQNSSGSTHLLAFIKDQNPNAILVGERTGGSAEGATAGIIFTLTLPESGIKMRVPAMQSFMNIKSFAPGLGIFPDIEAPMTAEAFLEGRDPALEKALELAGASQDFDTASLD